jgi:hypothetical protein
MKRRTPVLFGSEEEKLLCITESKDLLKEPNYRVIFKRV